MRLSLALLALAVLAASAGAEIELTVYNQDLALIKETRTLDLTRGVQEVDFTGVPKRLLPATVHFTSLTDPAGTRVLEQNYRYDLLNRASLLERYRGQEVMALVDGQWKSVRLLAHGYPPSESESIGRILEVDGQILIEGFKLPALPEGLLLEPTLVWLLDAQRAGRHEIELSYLSEGMTWSADYVAVVGEKDRLDLTGWVTLNNTSGRAYEDARLKLVAGEVHRAPVQMPRYKGAPRAEAMLADAVGGFSEESFFEYHLYTLDRSTTLLDNEQKQVELLRAPGIAAERRYIFASELWQEDSQPRAVDVTVEFSNAEGKGPGIPLPKGTIRVYQADAQGRLQFAGEDAIDHTPEGERVRLKLGQAFDLRGERKIMGTERLFQGRVTEQQVSITLRNHKDEAVRITAAEAMPSYLEWRILESSMEYHKVSARRLEFTVPVPAKGEAQVTYKVRIES